MKKIVLLGGSIASLKAVEILKSREEEYQFILLLNEDTTVLDQHQYVDLVIRQAKFKSIEYKNNEFYEQNGIEIIRNKKVTRVNVTRKKIHFDDRSQLDFDQIIISDTPNHKFDDLKGTNKQGVFGFRKAKEIEQISTLAALNDTITIQSDQWWALDLALQLAKKEKEVILSISSRHPFIHGTDQKFRDSLLVQLSDLGVNVLMDNHIVEVLGESDVKAVKIKSGKVFAAELVILDNTHMDNRIFSDALEIDNNQIMVGEGYQSNTQDTYAVDFATERTKTLTQNYNVQTDLLEYQGILLAESLLGETIDKKKPIHCWSVEQEEFKALSVGQIVEGRTIEAVSKVNTDLGQMIKVFSKDQIVVGIVAVNVELNIQDLIRKIEEEQNIQAIIELLFQKIDEIPQELQTTQDNEDSEELSLENQGSEIKNSDSSCNVKN